MEEKEVKKDVKEGQIMGWQNIYKSQNIILVIAQKVSWLGHARRIKGRRLTNLVLRGKPIGEKKEGDARKIWTNGVQEDFSYHIVKGMERKSNQ